VYTTRQLTNRLIVQLLLTVAGVAGIAGLFLPFTFGTSPIDAALDKDFWRLAIPFFLAILASAASIRWVMSGSFSRLERAIAYIVSALIAGVTLSLWFPPFEERPVGPREWLAVVSPGPILALGIYFLIRNSRAAQPEKFKPVMAIQVAYLANAAFCLIGFFGDWQRGAYCVLVASAAFVLQILLALLPERDVLNS